MKSKKDVYAILYKRQLLFDDYVVFLPCMYANGVFDSTDNSFTDTLGNLYYGCDIYDFVVSSTDLTYYYDITPEDLKNRYQTDDINLAITKFYNDIKTTILIGKIDNSNKKIDLCEITCNMINQLSHEFLYKMDGKDSTVTLSRLQLQKLTLETDFDKLKAKLLNILKHSNSLKVLSEERGVDSVTTNALGKRITSFEVKPKDKEPEKPKTSIKQTNNVISAKDVYNFVTSSLVGQDEAVQDMISAIINNMHAINRNELIKPLLIGPTGSGKSLLFELLESILDIPVLVVDCNLLVQSGYEGQNIEDTLKNLYLLCNKDIQKVQRAIVFLDEIDKIAANGAGVSDIGVQQALLKFIEGHKYVVELDRFSGEKVVIDTSMMSIVVGGAFDKLTSPSNDIGYKSSDEKIKKNITKKVIKPKDLVKYGMISELVGRFNLIVQYDPITEDMIYEQINSSMISPIKIKKAYFLRNYRTILEFNVSYLEKLCKRVILEKAGFRGIKRIVNNSLKRVEFELQSEPISDRIVTLSEETLDNPNYYSLVKK